MAPQGHAHRWRLGLDNDQPQMLFVIVLLGAIAGAVAGATTLSLRQLSAPAVIALRAAACGA